MDPLRPIPGGRYYSVLGLNDDASPCAIRAAYKKLAMKWHPDKRSDGERVESKFIFQEIQEAYAVLSDPRKKTLYDAGFYNPDDDDDEIEGLSSFLNEMADMMAHAQDSQDTGKCDSLEDLQHLFVSMFSADLNAAHSSCPPNPASSNLDKECEWECSSYAKSLFDSCIMDENFPSSQTHFIFDDNLCAGKDLNSSSSKPRAQSS